MWWLCLTWLVCSPTSSSDLCHRQQQPREANRSLQWIGQTTAGEGVEGGFTVDICKQTGALQIRLLSTVCAMSMMWQVTRFGNYAFVTLLHTSFTDWYGVLTFCHCCFCLWRTAQDIAGCLTIEELTQSLNLYKLLCSRSWHIQACDASSGAGLYDGLDWLSHQLVATGV